MGSQADDDDPGPGEAPGPGPGLPGLLAGFERGGAWEAAAPSAALAAALQAAAGPDGLYEGAEAGALVGIAARWATMESWAAAGTLGALRAMTREDGQGRPLTRRRNDLPDGWDDSLIYQIAGALAMGPVSAQNLAGLAWTLGLRLPGIGRLLADGTLTKPKAKLIAATFEPLNEDEATRAEALILGELEGRTWFQVQRLAWRAALAVAPDAAERRRAAAERRRARVTVFREESGAVGLSGRDLPAAPALSGHANVLARADRYQASGAFPGHTLGALQALAYLHLLNNVTTEDAIAFARTATTEPPGHPGQDEQDPDDEDDEDPWADAGTGADAPGNGGDDGPATTTTRATTTTQTTTTVRATTTIRATTTRTTTTVQATTRIQATTTVQVVAAIRAMTTVRATAGIPATTTAQVPGGDPGDGDNPGDDADPGGGPGPDGGDGGADGPGGAGGPPALPEITAPLATLQRRAQRAGETRLLGPLDPALTRDLAAAAARSPHTRWEITTTDERGYATGHATARPRHRKRHQPHHPARPTTRSPHESTSPSPRRS